MASTAAGAVGAGSYGLGKDKDAGMYGAQQVRRVLLMVDRRDKEKGGGGACSGHDVGSYGLGKDKDAGMYGAQQVRGGGRGGPWRCRG